MITLGETQDGAVPYVMGGGLDPLGWYRVVTEEIGKHLGAAHARLFAMPARTATGFAWIADGEEARGYAELGAEQRRALTAAIGSILSDIRRLVESGAAPSLTAAWPGLREVPDFGHVFAVDGAPVLTAWGHAGRAGASGALARLDDGRAWRAPPRIAWPVYATTLALLAVLSLGVGLFLPLVGRFVVPAPVACQAAPGQLEALAEQARLIARGNDLQGVLSGLRDAAGQRQLACPVPRGNPQQSPMPPRRAALPQDMWNRRDIAMLDGCWQRTSDMEIISDRTGEHTTVKSWQMCFDRSGNGRQTVTLSDARSCADPLRAAFGNDRSLSIEALDECHFPDGLFMWRERMNCVRESDDVASCVVTNMGGTDRGGTWPAKFRREGN